MTNHFHLVVRTPKGNLIYGMKWLQSTFANRYHRYRKINGKLFQGRYKSLIVEESTYLRSLLHYVHLNPVRAGICTVSELKSYRWSSYWYLHQPRRRHAFMDFAHTLDSATGLEDTPRGRQKYADYLAWVAEDDAVQQKLAFEKMTRGWALGTKNFKKQVLAEAMEEIDPEARDEGARFEGNDLKEINELIWERFLERGLSALKKTRKDIVQEAKSMDWKIAIACALKRQTCAPNTWIANELNMGIPQAVSKYVGAFRAAGGDQHINFRDLIQKITE